jgi:hypothetical protein
MESENERMVMSVPRELTSATLLERLNAQLPEGLHVHACGETIEPPAADCVYQVTFAKPLSDERRILATGGDRDQVLSFTTRKGTLKKVAVKDIVKNIHMQDAMCLEMTLCCAPGKTVRPTEILSRVFGLSTEEFAAARIRKLKTSGQSREQRS